MPSILSLKAMNIAAWSLLLPCSLHRAPWGCTQGPSLSLTDRRVTLDLEDILSIIPEASRMGERFWGWLSPVQCDMLSVDESIRRQASGLIGSAPGGYTPVPSGRQCGGPWQEGAFQSRPELDFNHYLLWVFITRSISCSEAQFSHLKSGTNYANSGKVLDCDYENTS